MRGTLEAESLDAAKSALSDIHLEPVEVSETMHLRRQVQQPPGVSGAITAAEQPLLKTAYAFEGKDREGTVRRGTIQAATKRQAFDRLRHDQGLSLTMLAPLGIPPQSPDLDLQRWQSSQPIQSSPPPVKTWTPIDEVIPQTTAPVAPGQNARSTRGVSANVSYHPMLSTLRLYAGWLLVWYGLFLALGYYYSVRDISVDIPIVQGFASSQLVMTFMLAIFLFLLCTSLHRALKGGKLTASVLSVLGAGGFVGLRMLLT